MEDDFLPDGSEVKAGGMITYVPYSMGRMEYNWGSDAAAFNPDRWFKDGTFQTASPFKFTAFQVYVLTFQAVCQLIVLFRYSMQFFLLRRPGHGYVWARTLLTFR